MKIENEKLLRVLKSVSPAVDKSGVIEQSSVVYFDGNTVRTFNGEISIVSKLKSDIVGGIDAAGFTSLISKLEKGKIKVKIKKGSLKIISGSTRALLKMEKVKMPEIDISGKAWNNLPVNFCEGINLVRISAPSSDITPELSQVFVIKDKALSCDNFRATQFLLSESINQEIAISKTFADILYQYDVIQYTHSDDWVHFKDSSGTVLSCRIPSSKYPHKKVFALFNVEGAELKLPENFSRIIDRVGSILLGIQDDKLISLIFAKGQITLKGKSESGYVKEEIRSDYSGESFSVQVNPKFLAEVLKYECKVKVSKSCLLVQGTNFNHIISLQSEE